MKAATVALLRWLVQQYPAFRPYEVGRTLIGHSHIAPKHRANCPGPNADLFGLASATNAPTSHRYRLKAPAAVFEAPSTRGPIALQGAAVLQAGAIVEVDDARADGWFHLSSGLGFIPAGVVEAV